MPEAALITATILGCGSSGGVPRIGNIWGDCDPAEPRNRRTRASALVEHGDTRILIDDRLAQTIDERRRGDEKLAQEAAGLVIKLAQHLG